MPRGEYVMKPIASTAVAILPRTDPMGPVCPGSKTLGALRIANAGAAGIFAQFKALALV